MLMKSTLAIQNNSPRVSAPSPAMPPIHCIVRTVIIRKTPFVDRFLFLHRRMGIAPLHQPRNGLLCMQSIQLNFRYAYYTTKFGRCQVLYEPTPLPTWSTPGKHRTDTGPYHRCSPR